MKRSLILIFCVAVLFVAGGCGSYATVMHTNWQISLPDSCEFIYETDSGASFHGDGLRYHVCSCTDSDEINAIFEWSEAQQETIFYNSRLEAAQEYLDELGVTEDLRGDFSVCLSAYDSQEDNSELFIFYDDAGGLLYIIESFL